MGNAKRIAKRIAEWLPDSLDSDQRLLVSTVSQSLEWNETLTGAFCVALLEDVNMHSEASSLNLTLLGDPSGVVLDMTTTDDEDDDDPQTSSGRRRASGSCAAPFKVGERVKLAPDAMRPSIQQPPDDARGTVKSINDFYNRKSVLVEWDGYDSYEHPPEQLLHA